METLSKSTIQRCAACPAAASIVQLRNMRHSPRVGSVARFCQTGYFLYVNNVELIALTTNDAAHLDICDVEVGQVSKC